MQSCVIQAASVPIYVPKTRRSELKSIKVQTLYDTLPPKQVIFNENLLVDRFFNGIIEDNMDKYRNPKMNNIHTQVKKRFI